MRQILSVLVGCAIVLAACSRAAAPGADTASQPVPGAATVQAPLPSAATNPPAADASLPPASPDAWLAVGRAGSDGLVVILASSAEQMLEMPIGIHNQNWSRLVSTSVTGDTTTLTENVVQLGLGGPQLVIDGRWKLPTIGDDPNPVGISADESTYILVEAADHRSDTPLTWVSRFAVVKLVAPGVIHGATVRRIELRGWFDYDAISPDGSTLYVIEHLSGPSEPSGRYQVRAVDVAGGMLMDGIVADKRSLAEPMAGWPIAQVRRPDGGVFTLYRGTEHPFIHALSTSEGVAVCIDLPARGADDLAAARDWGLAESADGRSLYAINSTLGFVVDVDPAQLGIRRSVSVEPLGAGPRIVLAKFGHEPSGPVGRRVVVNPDLHTVYAAGAGGILAIGTRDLKVAGRLLEGAAIEALAITPDGGTLYALLGEGGRIVKLDAGSGELLGEVPGGGYDRLIAVAPW